MRIFFSVLIWILILSPFFVFAQGSGLVPCGTSTTDPCRICHFFVLLDNIIGWLVKVIIPIAGGFLLYGGILMISAGGSEEKIARGKKAITNALIGIFITLGAWLIIDFILGNLLDPDKIYFNWNEFPGCT